MIITFNIFLPLEKIQIRNTNRNVNELRCNKGWRGGKITFPRLISTPLPFLNSIILPQIMEEIEMEDASRLR